MSIICLLQVLEEKWFDQCILYLLNDKVDHQLICCSFLNWLNCYFYEMSESSIKMPTEGPEAEVEELMFGLISLKTKKDNQ